MNTVFSDNLRRLRQAKSYTQEQAAERLGISAQSVSRWECGNTLPDVLLLPAIAELYCVTVDDLYRENSTAYRHYADRLLAVYESTLDRDDFVRADNEYRRLLDSGACTTEDLRSYGVLHEIAMVQCMDKALLMYNEVFARGPEEDRTAYYRTRLQKIRLFSQTGRDDLNLKQQREELSQHPDDPWAHLFLLAALCSAGQYAEAYKNFQTAVGRFPDLPELYIYGADACTELGRIDEALELLDQGLSLDSEMYDAKYAKAHCLEALGNYSGACEVWTSLAAELEAAGFQFGAEEPRKLAETCRAKL